MEVAEKVRYYVLNGAQGSRPELECNGYDTEREAMQAINFNDGRKKCWVCRSATPEQFASWNKYNRWKIVEGKAVSV